MAHIKRKYIDSHWAVFIVQGVVMLLFGCLTLFTSNSNSASLIPVIGVSLVALAIVEFANSIYRSFTQQGWVVSTLVAVYDAVFGIAIMFLINESMAWHLGLLAAYTLIRGIFELLIGTRTTVDPTDRFIWVLCGLCGIVFSVVIFNSGHLANVDFVRFFGAYMLILGVSSLIYSVHNRDQQREDREARREVAKEARKKITPKSKSTKK